jgi:predicted phosphodiesterase
MIYLTGDTHGNLYRLNLIPAKKGDVVIICGDFGVLWSQDKLSEINEKKQIELAKSKDYDILFVDGNHENFNRIERLGTIQKYGNDVGVYLDNVFHLRRGNIYTIEGKKFFIFGGGLSIDKAFRIPHISYWEQELPNFKEYKNGLDNLEKENWKVDYILTHEAPESIANELLRKHRWTHKDPAYNLPKYLEEVKNKTTFKHWFFAHYHITLETFQEKFTQLYEGAIALEDE